MPTSLTAKVGLKVGLGMARDLLTARKVDSAVTPSVLTDGGGLRLVVTEALTGDIGTIATDSRHRDAGPESVDRQTAPVSELWSAVGDGGNREGGISWGCLTGHRRSEGRRAGQPGSAGEGPGSLPSPKRTA